jgi:hypothetical protein
MDGQDRQDKNNPGIPASKGTGFYSEILDPLLSYVAVRIIACPR